MAIEVVLPNLGIAVERGTIVEWIKKEGDPVVKGEALFVVEVEKVTTEVESPASGILAKILVPIGVEVPILTVVAVIVASGEELPEKYMRATEGIVPDSAEVRAEPASGSVSQASKDETVTESEEIRIVPAARRLAEEKGLDIHNISGSGPGGVILVRDIQEALKIETTRGPKASPTARAMAEVHHIDLAGIAGSGPGGKILKEDLLRVLEGKGDLKRGEAERHPEIHAETAVEKEIAESIPIKGVRRVIFENMYQSLSQSAQLTLHTEASAESLIRLRNGLSRDGLKVSYNAILIKMTAMALRRHPKINASVEGNDIRVWKQIHIGLAMEANDALIVPVLRSPDQKSIRRIEEDVAGLVSKIKSNKLNPDDLVNGTFTITNLGFADIDYFTPIIRPPESAILGIGRIVKKPVVRDDHVLPEARMGLSLTFDHRIIDGAPAARLLKTIKDLIEEPALLID